MNVRIQSFEDLLFGLLRKKINEYIPDMNDPERNQTS